MTHDAFPIAADLREPDEVYRRQAVFRDRVSATCTVRCLSDRNIENDASLIVDDLVEFALKLNEFRQAVAVLRGLDWRRGSVEDGQIAEGVLQVLNRGIPSYAHLQCSGGEAAAFRARGVLHEILGRTNEAKADLLFAVRKREGLTQIEVADSFLRLGDLCLASGNQAKDASSYYAEGCGAISDPTVEDVLAVLHDRLGRISESRGNYREARSHLAKAKELLSRAYRSSEAGKLADRVSDLLTDLGAKE